MWFSYCHIFVLCILDIINVYLLYQCIQKALQHTYVLNVYIHSIYEFFTDTIYEFFTDTILFAGKPFVQRKACDQARLNNPKQSQHAHIISYCSTLKINFIIYVYFFSFQHINCEPSGSIFGTMALIPFYSALLVGQSTKSQYVTTK